MKLLFLATTLLYNIISNAQNCINIPQHFSSYSDAIKQIKEAVFNIKDSADVSHSSWIETAYYYSCDEKYGYFIYSTNKREYIYNKVPLSIWMEFKNAKSKGSYYDHFIKGRYKFNLNH